MRDDRPALFLWIALFCRLTSAAITEPVRLDSGLISGVSTDSPDLRVFKGIPYAAPPVGDLRWHAPIPPAAWSGVRHADQFSPICPQLPYMPGSFYQLEFFQGNSRR